MKDAIRRFPTGFAWGRWQERPPERWHQLMEAGRSGPAGLAAQSRAGFRRRVPDDAAASRVHDEGPGVGAL